MADEAPGGDLIDVFSRRRRAEARAAKDGARPTFVVKLGGAALTKKDELETVSPRWEEVIRAVCGVYRDAGERRAAQQLPAAAGSYPQGARPAGWVDRSAASRPRTLRVLLTLAF